MESDCAVEHKRRLNLGPAGFMTCVEVIGVFFIGMAIAYFLGRALKLESFLGQMSSELSSPRPDFLRLAWIVGASLVIQYIGLFTPALLIGWRRGRRHLSDYGLTTASNRWISLVGSGIVLFAFGALPAKLLFLVNKYFPMGPGSDFWALLNVKWNFEFWIFMAVGSYVLVPFVEELFFRGYLQARLAESFGGIPAILISSFFFTFLHSAYHKLSVLCLGTILTLIFDSVCVGYIYHRTRSLIAPMVAHALIDIPFKGVFDLVVPILMIVIFLLLWRKISTEVRQFLKEFRLMESKGAIALGIIFFTMAAIVFTKIFNVL
jgi:membrane protease YdiL (CAAX protease family)